VLEGKEVLMEGFLGPADTEVVLRDAIGVYAREREALRQQYA